MEHSVKPNHDILSVGTIPINRKTLDNAIKHVNMNNSIRSPRWWTKARSYPPLPRTQAKLCQLFDLLRSF